MSAIDDSLIIDPDDILDPDLDAIAPAQPDGAAGGPAAGGTVVGDEVFTDTRGRRYFRHNGKTVYVRKNETVDQARERAANGPKDSRPNRGTPRATPKRPPAPKTVDLKALEAELAEALSAPAMICAMVGDTWGADHFTRQGPLFARNLVAASERNPWLKRKLEDWARGGDSAMQLIALLGVGGALLGYAVPPIIYYLNLPAPEMARMMFGIPPRKTEDADAGAESPYPSA